MINSKIMAPQQQSLCVKAGSVVLAQGQKHARGRDKTNLSHYCQLQQRYLILVNDWC